MNQLHHFTHSAPGLSISYSQQLIRRRSITPVHAGCQQWLSEKLSELGFTCISLKENGVSNLIAWVGEGEKNIAFSGHTDVVPPGPESKWTVSPFAAEVIDDELIGRGAADMKTGIGAMLAATERLLSQENNLKHRFYWLITSDEEGEAEYGSQVIAHWLKQREIVLDMCIVGEPTATLTTGDNIKIGRRGALSARLTVKGRQGHVAYPQYADNAVHKMQRMMEKLLDLKWDEGSDDFPGTGLQITFVNSGDFTDNIVPAFCELCFNIRYSHQYTERQLKALISKTLANVCTRFELNWERPCEPYFTHNNDSDSLISAVERVIHKNTGRFPLLSTSGGTSDGRFFSNSHTQVVEVGVPNKTIHQINERVQLTDLLTLEDIYSDLLQDLLNGD